MPRTVNPHLDDTKTIGELPQNCAQVRLSAGQRVPHAMGAADIHDGSARWRAEDAFKIHCPAWLAGSQQGEDATSVIVDDDDGQVGPRLVWTDEQTVAVVKERQVAHQRVGRSLRLSEREADSGGHTPVDATQSAAGHDGQRRASDRRRHGQVNIAGRVGGTKKQRSFGWELGQDRGRDGKPARPSRLDDRPGGFGHQLARIGPLPRPVLVDLSAVLDGCRHSLEGVDNRYDVRRIRPVLLRCHDLHGDRGVAQEIPHRA